MHTRGMHTWVWPGADQGGTAGPGDMPLIKITIITELVVLLCRHGPRYMDPLIIIIIPRMMMMMMIPIIGYPPRKFCVFVVGWSLGGCFSE